MILSVRVAGDREEARRSLRAVWGGNLCVAGATHTQAELLAVLEELQQVPGWLGSGLPLGGPEVSVTLDDGALQRELDRRYGKDVVRVKSALRPYPRSLASAGYMVGRGVKSR